MEATLGLGTIYRYLRSVSVPMRVGLVAGTLAIGIPLLREMLTSPLWGILLGALAGVNAYLLADRKVPGYRAWVILILMAPTLLSRGTAFPWDDISTGAIVFAFLGLAIAFEPGEFSAFLKWSRKRETRVQSPG